MGFESNPNSHQNHHHSHRPFSKLLAKEVSQPNSSCRIYYGETAVAIPFVWESQPGTPKHILFENSSLPPLTPPPSYTSKSTHRSLSVSAKPKLELLVNSIFPRNKSARSARRISHPPSLSSLSSSSSSTSSLSNSSFSKARASKEEFDEPEYEYSRGSSPTSTLCFPAMKKTAWKFVGGCYAAGK